MAEIHGSRKGNLRQDWSWVIKGSGHHLPLCSLKIHGLAYHLLAIKALDERRNKHFIATLLGVVRGNISCVMQGFVHGITTALQPQSGISPPGNLE